MIWKCKEKLIEYGSKVLIMGIVNVTPDSFSDGGLFVNAENAVKHALELERDGADIIDIGAQSTRPGYNEISPQEEWERLEPVLKELRGKTPLPISVDTYFPFVAKRALETGADIINDVSGALLPEMAEIIKESGAGWVIMHNGAGGINEVGGFFKNAKEKCREYGISPEQLCFDMGIGFGKSYEENLELIANVEKYKQNGFPLLLGVSRKRVIGAASCQPEPEKRIYGNISADTAAVLGGADIIRIHDVKNEIQGVRTAQEIKKWIK